MSKNVNTEELYEELGVLNKTISSLEEYLKELGNDCNTIYNYAHELKSYHGKMVANSKKIVDNGDGGVTSTVSYQLFKVNVGKELLNYSDGVSSCLKDIQEGLNKMKVEIQNNFGSIEQIEQGIVEITYKVNSGDTLSKIAQKYGFTYQELAEYNKLADPNLILVDQLIKIPFKVSSMKSTDSKNDNDYEEYVVQRGDTLLEIAKEKLGDSSRYTEIATLSGIANPNLLNIGDKLLIPKHDSTETVPDVVIDSFPYDSLTSDEKKRIYLDNLKPNTKVYDAYHKYTGELDSALYATVDENIFTTTSQDTINGQDVLVTHIVVNDSKQVSSYTANGQYGTGGQTVTSMVQDVKQQTGEEPVVAIFGSHYLDGGYQDQTGGAALTNGVIIRDGAIIKDGVTKGNELQLWNDGTIHTSTGQSAQELLDLGVVNTETCHSVPAIINGSTARSYEETKLYKRNVLGSTNTGEYYVVTDLTYNNALSDTAEYLKNKGCVEAQSLDQGGSVELAIYGQVVNNLSDSSGERYGADMIYFTS